MEPDDTKSVAEAARQARGLLDAFDNVAWPEMNALFYMGAYDEFRLALEQLLDALERQCRDS